MSIVPNRVACLGLAWLVVVSVTGCGEQDDGSASVRPVSGKAATDDATALQAENSRLAAENEQLKAALERVKEYIESPPGYADEAARKPVADESTPSARADCIRKAKSKYRIALSMCAIQFEFSKDLDQQKKCIRKARDAYDKDLASCRGLSK